MNCQERCRNKRKSETIGKTDPKINHEETKNTKIFSGSFFVFFVSSWLIYIC